MICSTRTGNGKRRRNRSDYGGMGMAKISLYIATSLDGFIADAGGGVGWLPAGDGGDGNGNGGDDCGYADFYAAVSALIMGRRTYDQVRGFGDWPYPGKPTYVFATRPGDEAAPAAVRCVQTTAADFAQTVATQYADGIIWLVGGATLAEQFRAAGLIDEYRVFVIPVILGRGISLFGGDDNGDVGASPTPLHLVETQTYGGGIVMLRYCRQGG